MRYIRYCWIYTRHTNELKFDSYDRVTCNRADRGVWELNVRGRDPLSVTKPA